MQTKMVDKAGRRKEKKTSKGSNLLRCGFGLAILVLPSGFNWIRCSQIEWVGSSFFSGKSDLEQNVEILRIGDEI